MKDNKGFTLIELLVVIVILISISAIALPNVLTTLDKNKEQEIQNQKEMLASYMEIYDSKNNNFLSDRLSGCKASVSSIIEFLQLDNSKFEKIISGYYVTYSEYTYVYENNESSLKTCSLE